MKKIILLAGLIFFALCQLCFAITMKYEVAGYVGCPGIEPHQDPEVVFIPINGYFFIDSEPIVYDAYSLYFTIEKIDITFGDHNIWQDTDVGTIDYHSHGYLYVGGGSFELQGQALPPGDPNDFVLPDTFKVDPAYGIPPYEWLSYIDPIEGYTPRWTSMDFSKVAPVPEPATMLLLGTGLVCLATTGKKKFFNKK